MPRKVAYCIGMVVWLLGPAMVAAQESEGAGAVSRSGERRYERSEVVVAPPVRAPVVVRQGPSPAAVRPEAGYVELNRGSESVAVPTAVLGPNRRAESVVVRATISKPSPRIRRREPCQRLTDQQINQDELAASYYPLWKNRVKAANGFNDEEFDRHFVVTEVRDFHTPRQRGHVLTISFCIKLDWFTQTNHSDHLWMLFDPEFEDQHSLGLPRNVYLTEEEINIVNDVYRPALVIDAVTPLLFRSKLEAVEKLSEAAGVLYPEDSLAQDLVFNDQVLEPCLQGIGKVNEDANQCRHGMINLISGEIKLRDIACRN